MCLECSNVTLKPLHTGNNKTESHFKQHKFIESVAVIYIDYFNKAAALSLDL